MTELVGPVEVVGAGLLGTSIGLACRRAGLEVLLSDASPEHVRTASGLGAGRARTPEDRPRLVVVAVPLVVAGWSAWMWRAWRGRPATAPSTAAVVLLAAVLLVFTVARNVPALAPWLAP